MGRHLMRRCLASPASDVSAVHGGHPTSVSCRVMTPYPRPAGHAGRVESRSGVTMRRIGERPILQKIMAVNAAVILIGAIVGTCG